MPRTTFARLWEQLAAEGVVSITAAALARRAGASLGATYRAVHAAQALGLLISPAKGFYVLVPPDYRAWKTVPPEWYLADLMAHWRRPYYLGYLSAAAWHGLAVPAGHATQVVVDRPIRSRNVGGAEVHFHVAADVGFRPTTLFPGPTGPFRLAGPETLALDLAERPREGGDPGALLSVMAHLPLQAEPLWEAARRRPRSVVRRLGWLLETAGADLPLEPLLEAAQPQRQGPTPLLPGGPSGGVVDRRWGVRVNLGGEGGGVGGAALILTPPRGLRSLPIPTQDLAAWRWRVAWRDDRLVAQDLLAFLMALRVAADPYLGTRLAWVGEEAYQRLDLPSPVAPVCRVKLAPLREVDVDRASRRLLGAAAELGEVARVEADECSRAARRPQSAEAAPSGAGAEVPPMAFRLFRSLVFPPVAVGIEVEVDWRLLQPRGNPRRIRRESQLRLWRGEAWILTLPPEELRSGDRTDGQGGTSLRPPSGAGLPRR